MESVHCDRSNESGVGALRTLEAGESADILELVRTHDLAQLNIGRLVAPTDSPLVAEFIEALDEVNALADRSPGFVWRFQTDEGNAIAERPFSDDTILVNFSTWESVSALSDYVYRSAHAEYLRRRREWFERLREVVVVLWWVPVRHQPTAVEAIERLELLRLSGPTPQAFTFRQRFEPEATGAEHTDPGHLPNQLTAI